MVTKSAKNSLKELPGLHANVLMPMQNQLSRFKMLEWNTMIELMKQVKTTSCVSVPLNGSWTLMNAYASKPTLTTKVCLNRAYAVKRLQLNF